MERLIFEYKIPDKPIPWKRPGRFGARYFDQQAHEKKRLQTLFRVKHRDFIPLDIPIKCKFIFQFTKPIKNRKYHNKKPDLSNLIKFYEDCFNGFIWEDDSQIYAYKNCQKTYGTEPFTLIKVYDET